MSGLIGLVVALAALVVAAAVTRRAPVEPVPDREGYFDRWQPLHGGVDPRTSPWVRGWLAIGYAVARPLARAGIHPDVLTVASAWVALGAVVATAAGGTWLVVAGWLVVGTGLVDTLDGAVATATGRTSRWGYVLDSAVDRVTDVLFLMAAHLAGAPAWLALTAGVLAFLLEYVRARGRNAGASEVGVVSVGERPVRVICCAIAVAATGLLPGLGTRSSTASIGLLTALSLTGLIQVAVAVRRDLQALDVRPG